MGKSEGVSNPNQLTRREFLKVAGAAGVVGLAASLLTADRGVERVDQARVVPEWTQFDLPEGKKLLRVNKGNTLDRISRSAHIGVEELMVVNGILDPRDLLAGEALILPSIATNDSGLVEINSFKGLAPFQPVITRAVPNPDIPADQDFEPDEIIGFNRFSRGASLELPRLLGMGVPHSAGFFRVLRPSQSEIDRINQGESRGAGGWVDVGRVCSSASSRAEKDGLVKAAMSCDVRGFFNIYLLSRLSDPAFQYSEQQKEGFGKQQYFDLTNVLLRHEILHLFFGNLQLPPFDSHQLIYSLSDYGLDLKSDNGYVNNGVRVGERFYHRDNIEWYVVRQFPELLSKLFPWARSQQADGKVIQEDLVLSFLRSTEPGFAGWQGEYNMPLRQFNRPLEGKTVVWSSGSDSQKVSWFIPGYHVRWPTLNEKIQGWTEDFRKKPMGVNGTLLYRSWKFIGQSRWGEVPEKAQTATAMAFQNPFDPSGQMTANPSESWVKPAAWWK